MGYRVPMIIASPWSKGGFVNSQIFDHTSTLMFLEDFFKHKGKSLHCNNISSWRRAICGDLTSVFRPYNKEKIELPDFEQYESTIRNIQNAKDKPRLNNPDPATKDIKEKINRGHISASQDIEKGTRPACALPYDNCADYKLNEKGEIILQFSCGDNIGTPYSVYTQSNYNGDQGKCWDFALEKSKALNYTLWLDKFEKKQFDIVIQGPNGFFRHFYGDDQIQGLDVSMLYEKNNGLQKISTGNLYLHISNTTNSNQTFLLEDISYEKGKKTINVLAHSTMKLKIVLAIHHWYDLKISVPNIKDAAWHYAGHVENGKTSISDPLMGNTINKLQM